MATPSQLLLAPLVKRLDTIFALNERDRADVAALPARVMDLKADQDIVRAGDRTTRSCTLLNGMACSYKLTGEGKRQITAFHFYGEIPDLHSVHLEMLDSSLGTLTPCTVAFIQHEHIIELCQGNPRLAAAFWRSTLIDGAIFREWTTNIGQRQAQVRLAHVICEIATRLRALGEGEGDSFEVPITQTTLADATGMSTVHVNRTAQALRAKKLIRWTRTTLEILDWDGLVESADFDPAYLHLEKRRAPSNHH